ncbi:MAG TPA: putative 2-aminoethylphosphonate ABC transporter permease subunit [Anaerolineales bacterium]|nr:putative 2-aminoethylphosphonate ABC transporter permease subunit [Anaerolineales bacterium]
MTTHSFPILGQESETLDGRLMRSHLPMPIPARAEVLKTTAARPTADWEGWLKRLLILFVVLWLFIGIVLPLFPLILRNLSDSQGRFVGLANYQKYFSSPALSLAFTNSLTVSLLATLISVGLAFGYAYALTRTCMPAKRIFQSLAMLPLYAPSLAHGIGLVYLFGRKGLVTTGLGWNIHLYGLPGIVLGEVLYCMPQALMILTIAASLADARLYEASRTLRASPLRTFLTVTLPGLKYGLFSALFVCFTLAFTDFGVPKVVGGNFNVLATDIYKQVIGQQNFAMGATISLLLLLPTGIAFVLDRIVQRRQAAILTARSVPFQPQPKRWIDLLALVYCLLVALAVAVVMSTVFLAAVIKLWPYQMSLTLRHFDFRTAGGGGYGAFFNSLRISFYTALIGTTLTFGSAYLIEKLKEFRAARWLAYLVSMIPMALPGLVIGLAYIFFFNPLQWKFAGLSIANPFAFLYNTMAVLVLANVVHFYTVSFMTATTALKQLDHEFEAVSASLAVPFYRTLWKITLPLCLPAILEIAMYYFVNAMVTVSAVIFLYSPQLKLASVAIVNMDDAGDTAAAAAMSALVILACLAVRLLYGWATRSLARHAQAWRTR